MTEEFSLMKQGGGRGTGGGGQQTAGGECAQSGVRDGDGGDTFTTTPREENFL